ncbi:MAG: hypothetical protein C0602_03845 [Denitrovibrio sp.]|nr:MAG: hypothetical protein C0602_03845 [Denitrovibrio sp.]
MSLKQFHNIHHGKRAFIAATGPSLRVEDLELLKDEITLSCNKVYLSFEKTLWRPDFYSVIDRLVAEGSAEKVAKVDSVKIFSSVIKPYIAEDNDIFWLNDLPSPTVDGKRESRFSCDISQGTYGGHTVVYTLMQIAYYIGIKELFLIGLDFNFENSKETGEKTSANEKILVQDKEVNHFHPDYRKPGEKWTVPRLDIMYDAFACARDAFEKDGRKIYNASRFTKLDVFPLVNLDDVLKK